MNLVDISKELSRKVAKLDFGSEVKFVYNPLEYAWEPHKDYLQKYGSSKKKSLLLGMNPGPFGMAQTGVPFGEVTLVRDWLKINGKVSKPQIEHPKRPITGFDCLRSEVSGARLWGYAKEKFKTPEKFFNKFFVWNFCPLVFMEEGGKNLTPDKLKKEVANDLFEVCDDALSKVIDLLEPTYLIGVGKFAEKQLINNKSSINKIVSTIIHPSPASPIANRGWAQAAEKKLIEIGALS